MVQLLLYQVKVQTLLSVGYSCYLWTLSLIL